MNKSVVPIVTVSSAEYLDYALVMMWSVLEHGNSGTIYHFYLFHNELTEGMQNWFKEQLLVWENCIVSFLDIRTIESKFLPAPGEWTGKLACFSLFCVDFLPQYDKVLALDIDLIVQRDIAQLYNTKMDNALLGAVYDLDFIGQWCKGNREYHRYYKEEVPLPDPKHYIQTGVLVINLQELRKNFLPGLFITVAAKKKFRYDDQDIWNLYVGNRVMKLDYRWNVLHNNNQYRLRYVMDFAPLEEFQAYMESRKDPFIVHYAGDQKPWDDMNCDFGDVFWDTVKHTPVSEKITARVSPKSKTLHSRCLRKLYYEWRRLCEKLRHV